MGYHEEEDLKTPEAETQIAALRSSIKELYGVALEIDILADKLANGNPPKLASVTEGSAMARVKAPIRAEIDRIRDTTAILRQIRIKLNSVGS